MKSKIEKAAAEDDVTQEAEDKQTMEIATNTRPVVIYSNDDKN